MILLGENTRVYEVCLAVLAAAYIALAVAVVVMAAVI